MKYHEKMSFFTTTHSWINGFILLYHSMLLLLNIAYIEKTTWQVLENLSGISEIILE